MARNRLIKPAFFASAQVNKCSPLAVLMFLYLWTEADDRGVLPHRPDQILIGAFPGRREVQPEDIPVMLAELVANDLMTVYDADGQSWLWITGWLHQRLDKPTASYPPPPVSDERWGGRARAVCRRHIERGGTENYPWSHPPEGNQIQTNNSCPIREGSPSTRGVLVEGSQSARRVLVEGSQSAPPTLHLPSTYPRRRREGKGSRREGEGRAREGRGARAVECPRLAHPPARPGKWKISNNRRSRSRSHRGPCRRHREIARRKNPRQPRAPCGHPSAHRRQWPALGILGAPVDLPRRSSRGHSSAPGRGSIPGRHGTSRGWRRPA